MRRLLIDQGNSRIKLAWCDDKGLDRLPVADSVDAVLERLHIRPDVVWWSSVADSHQTSALAGIMSNAWDVPLNRVTVPHYEHHLPTCYVASNLGVDRWLAMLGILRESPGPFLVVDAGTAITLDVVNERGEHQGGYILPGLKLSQKALLAGTAIELPAKDQQQLDELATDTGAAISQGILLSVVALIERISARLPDGRRVFVGGGDADRISARLQVPHDMVHDMVLKGLSRLASLEEM